MWHNKLASDRRQTGIRIVKAKPSRINLSISSMSKPQRTNDDLLVAESTHFQQTAPQLEVFVEIPIFRTLPPHIEDTKTANISIKRKLLSSDQQELVNQKRLKMEVKVEAHTRAAIKEEEHDTFDTEAAMDYIDVKPIKTKRKTCKAEENIMLPPATIARYLEGLSDLIINPAPPSTQVSRDMLNLHYGTSKIQFLTRISAAKNPSFSHPRRDRLVICATAERNPAMPQAPGRSGLLFSCRKEMTNGLLWSLFTRVGASLWEYEGEYKCFQVGVLTPQEFNAQPEKVKHAWARKVLTTEKWAVYKEMRARIYLRKQKKNITLDAVKKAVELLRSHGSRKKDTHVDGWEGKLTDRDTLNAFVRGDEKIAIIAMECVRFDHCFAQDIIKRLSEEMSPPRAPPKKGSKAKASGTRSTRTRGKPIAIIQHGATSDDEDSEGLDDNDDYEEED